MIALPSNPLRRTGRVRAALAAALLLAASGVSLAAGRTPVAPASSASAPSLAEAYAAKKKAARAAQAAPKKLVDINNASRKELKTLPGIGDAEADRIIANRPYLTKAHIATKQAVPEGVYLAIRRSIIVGPSKADSKKS